jgi:uncharacterized protein YkwD
MKSIFPILFLFSVFSSSPIKENTLTNLHPLDEIIKENNFNRRLLIDAIFDATNVARQKEGLSILLFEHYLDTAANYQAYRMFSEKKMKHKWPRDKDFGHLLARVETLGGDFKSLGENIARNFILNVKNGQEYYLNEKGQATNKRKVLILNKTYRELAFDAVNDWLNSPGHRENLLGDFDYLGIGVSPLVPLKKGPNFDIYLCQNFGSK